MTKPTYKELLRMLIELATVADNCIPSDDCSNMQLANAEGTIAQAWAMITQATRQ